MNRRSCLYKLGLSAVFAMAMTSRGSIAQEKRVIGKITKTDEEWRKILPPEAYKVLAQGRHRARRHQPVECREAQGRLPLRGLRSGAVHFGDEVRQRHRLAEFFRHAARFIRNQPRLQIDSAAHRIPLRTLRRASRSCFRRRSASDQAALLQQRRCTEVRAGLRRISSARFGVERIQFHALSHSSTRAPWT